MTLAGVRLRGEPAEAAAQVRALWLGMPAPAWREGGPMEPFAITGEVVDILDELGVAYILGGSLASGVHGEPRATRDADLVVRLGRRPAYVLLPAGHEGWVCGPCRRSPGRATAKSPDSGPGVAGLQYSGSRTSRSGIC